MFLFRVVQGVGWCCSEAKWHEQQMCTCVSTYNQGRSQEKQIINTPEHWDCDAVCAVDLPADAHFVERQQIFTAEFLRNCSEFLPSLLLLPILSRFILVKTYLTRCFYDGGKADLLCSVKKYSTLSLKCPHSAQICSPILSFSLRCWFYSSCCETTEKFCWRN